MKKIVFIEDEPALQKSLTMALKANGFSVFSAFDGETGMNLIKETSPDLILLDLILPKKDGFQILEEIKSDKETKDIPVVVLTNLEDASNVEKVIELGATNYLIKANYTADEIAQKVKSMFL